MSNDKDRCFASPPEGRYVNYFRIGFNAQEFLFDFGQLEQGYEDDDGRCHTRLVVVPTNTKRFLELLRKSVEGYERTFGRIPDPDETP